MPSKAEYYNPAYPSASNAHWIPWLQKQLLIADIQAATPEIPHSYEPSYATWAREFERYNTAPETTLVGHSCGGGFLVRWLSEHTDTRVGKVVLIAPRLDPQHEFAKSFFTFDIDPRLVSRTKGVTVFHSDDDVEMHESLALLQEKLSDLTIKTFRGYGHFVRDELRQSGFPELLEAILAT